jgi:glycosyltransferase involved in cell wall biosynthesis
MRILMLAQFYPPTVGGEEHHVQVLSRELAARGHRVAVATLWHDGLPEFEVVDGVRIYRIHGALERAGFLFEDKERRHAPPFPDPGLAAALSRIVRRERPQIVHAHNWLLRSFLPLKAWSGAKLVSTVHDYGLVCATQNFLYHNAPCSGPGFTKCLACATRHYGALKGTSTAISNWAMAPIEVSVVDMYLSVSNAPANADRFAERGIRYAVIPNFLSEEPEQPSGEMDSLLARLPEEDFLLYVGDLRRFKGINILLKAYVGLKDPPPLVLIGRECEGMPQKLPRNVHMMNSWPHKAVMRAWERSLVCVLPSVGPETFGMVALEAMSKGRPVIASNIGGLPDVVADGETGLLAPPGDVDALRAALERLLGDPELRAQMGQAALLKAREFSASVVVPKIEEIYSSLLRDKHAMTVAEVTTAAGEK